jgi:hypothetical protein
VAFIFPPLLVSLPRLRRGLLGFSAPGNPVNP